MNKRSHNKKRKRKEKRRRENSLVSGEKSSITIENNMDVGKSNVVGL